MTIRDGYIRQTQWGMSLFTRDNELVASASAGGRNEAVKSLEDLAMGLRMVLPITPDNAPDRFTDEEKEMFYRGECGHQVAYGMPWTEYCQRDSNPAADFGECTRHATGTY